jgi:hypothetical protein
MLISPISILAQVLFWFGRQLMLVVCADPKSTEGKGEVMGSAPMF